MSSCKYETSSICLTALPSSFCPCQALPVVLCAACTGQHTSVNRMAIHEIVPIEALSYWAQPDYRQSIKERMQKCKEARKIVGDTELGIESWKKSTCEIMNNMIDRLIETREKIKSELSELKAELLNAIETGLQEAQQSLYSPQPVLRSPFAKALFASSSGAVRIWSLQTDFEGWTQAFDRFLFSVDVRLQLKLPNFEPTGLIKTIADINIDRKVNIYLPSPNPNYTAESRQAHSQCSSYPLAADLIPLIYRGPVSDEKKNVYIGQWNADNQSHGFGQLYQQDGGVYEGQFQRDTFSGSGRFVSKEGTTWECGWKQHTCNGFGHIRELAGEVYTGEMREDKKHGYGFTQYADTDTNEAVCHFGQYAEDEPHGLGAIVYKSGYMYLGAFKEGEAHGKGLCRDSDDSLYYGDFAAGDMEGEGVWLLPDGRVYRGEMREDVMCGRGKMREAGREFEGKWQDGELRTAEGGTDEREKKRKLRKTLSP